jgi:hypothetical protein
MGCSAAKTHCKQATLSRLDCLLVSHLTLALMLTERPRACLSGNETKLVAAVKGLTPLMRATSADCTSHLANGKDFCLDCFAKPRAAPAMWHDIGRRCD